MPSLLFTPHLAALNVWQVFLITDRVGQAVICLLAVFSIFAWALMMGKYSELKKLRELNFAFERRLGEQRHILDLPDNLKNRRDIPYADLLADALEAYWRAAAIGKEKGDDTPRGRLEHAENDLFPATDLTEDWLKLTDFDPDNVVRLGPIRPRRTEPSGVV